MAANPHLERFMKKHVFEGLTFDDVSLVTQYADFLPNDADVSTRLTRRIGLNMPFVSAAMDTVTEARMAISMALMGGIGIIHKNIAAEAQADMVRGVKSYLNGLIAHPVTFRVGQTLQDVERERRKNGYTFNGFPILNDQDEVVGILSSRDVRYAQDRAAKVESVMTGEVITAPKGTTLKKAYEIMMKHRVGKLPLVDKGRLVGLYSFTDVQMLVEKASPQYNRDAKFRLRAGAAIGPNDQERAQQLAAQDVDVIVVDTAHGHSKGVIDMARWIKKNLPEVDVVAGNIATSEAALALRKAGADAVKVGIGPGSICTTRVVAGVGIPQISAIYQCAKALNDEIPVIADGGIRFSGDVAKAIAAGADSVMMGGVLAGTDESPGEKVFYQGRQYVSYRGMGSLGAMQAGQGSRERYGQDGVASDELVPQGIEGLVPYSGTVRQVLNQFSGGLRAALGYCGCKDITALRARARFVRVSPAGVQESHPHDIKITKEAPNYKQ